MKILATFDEVGAHAGGVSVVSKVKQTDIQLLGGLRRFARSRSLMGAVRQHLDLMTVWIMDEYRVSRCSLRRADVCLLEHFDDLVKIHCFNL